MTRAATNGDLDRANEHAAKRKRPVLRMRARARVRRRRARRGGTS